jgi:hypothetical protein
MKKEKDSTKDKTKRPQRVVVTREEALQRMKDFPKRKEQFLAAARANKS